MKALAACVALALFAPAQAHAQLAGPRAGVWFDLSGGLATGDLPYVAGTGWSVGLGGWAGRYDSSFALGRSWGAGARLRQDVLFTAAGPVLRTAPLLEARRGIDLLVVGFDISLLGGPLWQTDLGGAGTRFAGGTTRLAGGVRYRFKPEINALVRLEAGIDIDQLQVQPVLGLTVGIAYATPLPRVQR